MGGDAGADGKLLFGRVVFIGLVVLVLIFLGFEARDSILLLCCDLLVGDPYG